MEELNASICPYCKQKFEKPPTRKKRCIYCDNYIYVRTSPLDRKRFLVTEKEAEKIDKEWEMYGDSNAGEFSESLLKNLENKFGCKPLLQDAIWAKFQEDSEKLMKESNKDVEILLDLSRKYYEQAEFLKKYGNKSNEYINKIFEVSKDVKRKYLKMTTLKSFIDSEVVKKIGISPCEDACQKCKEHSKIVMSLDEVLINNPLPISDCKHGWCRCDYSPIFEKNVE